jgi:hypothetical protein
MSNEYVQSVLAAYLVLPDTPRKTSLFDRRIARDLHDRAVPLATVSAAFVLAIARRKARPPGSVPLGSIRSLAYFLPVIEELLAKPMDPIYAEYLRRKAVSGLVPPPL